MIDFSEHSTEVLIARGCYSTVRAAHEEAKKRLAVECGNLTSLSSQILKGLQEDAIVYGIDALLSDARGALLSIEALANEIESLAKQRQELKAKAWPK